jgi:AraC family transcriptional regulator
MNAAMCVEAAQSPLRSPVATRALERQIPGPTPLPGDLEQVRLERLKSAIVEIYRAIRTVCEGDPASFAESIRRASEYLTLESPVDCKVETPEVPAPRPLVTFNSDGQLGTWRVRKLKIYIDSHLHERVTVNDLARVVKLSPSHFSRCFCRTFGESPHAYVSRRRIEYAQGLMLTTIAPLAQIASECGLADQSHLTRLFARFVGETPGAWRRARAWQFGE